MNSHFACHMRPSFSTTYTVYMSLTYIEFFCKDASFLSFVAYFINFDHLGFCKPGIMMHRSSWRLYIHKSSHLYRISCVLLRGAGIKMFGASPPVLST